MTAYQRLRARLDRLDREEAYQAWLDAGQPLQPAGVTALDWYRAQRRARD